MNNNELLLDMDWSPSGCLIRFRYMGVSYTVIDTTQYIAHVRWSMVATSSTEATIQMYVFPHTYPTTHPTLHTWVAPTYDVKYRVMYTPRNGSSFHVPSDDTGEDKPLLTRLEAERDCDAIPECEGILQLDAFTIDSWFSLYTTSSSIQYNNKEVSLKDNIESSIFLRKMSHIYKGKNSADEECAPVLARQSRYPSASYREYYNGPIKNIDLSSALDADTGAVIVGKGIWTNCWTRVSASTKIDCQQEAKNNGGYGFAFHNSVCIIYTGITNPNNIQINKFNSETGKTIYEPCDGDATWLAT